MDKETDRREGSEQELLRKGKIRRGELYSAQGRKAGELIRGTNGAYIAMRDGSLQAALTLPTGETIVGRRNIKKYLALKRKGQPIAPAVLAATAHGTTFASGRA